MRITLAFELKTLLGVAFLIFSSAGLLANIIVALAVFKLAFMKDKSTIFLLSAFNICNDTIHLIITCFYLAPGIIMDSYIYSDSSSSFISILISAIFMFCWYVANITLIIIALNRLCIVCFRNGDFFSRRNLLIIFAVTILFSAIKAYVIQYVFPCCAFIVDQAVLSYSYRQIDDLYNWTDTSDIPLNALTSIANIVCYSLVFRNIRQSRKNVQDTMKSDEQKKRRKRELSYAIQFSIISIFYTSGWILFRLFPIVVGNNGVEWYIVSATFHTCNCSANAVVYLLGNAEVKGYLSHMFCRHKKKTNPTSTRGASSMDPRSNSQIHTFNTSTN